MKIISSARNRIIMVKKGISEPSVKLGEVFFFLFRCEESGKKRARRTQHFFGLAEFVESSADERSTRVEKKKNFFLPTTENFPRP